MQELLLPVRCGPPKSLVRGLLIARVGKPLLVLCECRKCQERRQPEASEGITLGQFKKHASKEKWHNWKRTVCHQG